MDWGWWLLIAGLILVFITSGVLITSASINLGTIQNPDEFFKNAYYYAYSAAWTTWGLVAFFIIGIALYYGIPLAIGAAEPEVAVLSSLQKPAPSSGLWEILFTFILFILIIIIGFFASQAAYNINQSQNYNPAITAQYRAKEESISAAVICLTTTGIFIIYYLIKIIYWVVGEPETLPAGNELTQPVTPVIQTQSTLQSTIANLTPDDITKLKQLLK